MHPNATQCTHIKTNGALCKAPALKGEDLCYWHSRVDYQLMNNPYLGDFPVLDDGGAVQILIMKVIRAIAEKRIDYKAAQLMIWAAQVATRNMKACNEYVVREPGVDMRELLNEVLKRKISLTTLAGHQAAADSNATADDDDSDDDDTPES